MSLFSRVKLALSILFGGELPKTTPALPEPVSAPPALPPPAPGQPHASALFLLSIFQREGRLLDFLKEDLRSFSDAEIGAAARAVHEGCGKVLTQYLPLEAVVTQSEGATIDVPKGFDASRFRLTGNVTGEGPWKGSLKHHGWVVTKVALPETPTTIDVKVVAPAEVELP